MTPSTDNQRYEEQFEEESDEPDPFEEALSNCCGHFIDDIFWCGAAGSEDCDFECPFSRDIGLHADTIDERDEEEFASSEQPMSRADEDELERAEHEAENVPREP